MYGSKASANWRGCLSYAILQLGQPVGKLFVQEVFDETAKVTVSICTCICVYLQSAVAEWLASGI